MGGAEYKPLSEQGAAPSKCRQCCRAFLLTAVCYCSVLLLTFFAWQFYANSGGLPDQVVVNDGAGLYTFPPPPPHTQYARVARYVLHISDWAALATASTDESIEGYPFANVISTSDGPVSNSSGNPYFFFTPFDLTVIDLQKDPRVSLSVSLAQSSYCRTRDLDPEDPRCARLIVTGEMVKLQDGSAEQQFARTAMFQRHPQMADWPQDHNWFFARLAIRHIFLLNYFGGAKVIAPEDYFAASPPQ